MSKFPRFARAALIATLLCLTTLRFTANEANANTPNAIAKGDSETEDWKRWAILGHLALLYSPQGALGVEVERGLTEYLALSASAGVIDGPNAALGLRLRYPGRVKSAAIYPGISLGASYGDAFDGFETGHVADDATWLTFEGYLEYRRDSGPTVRLYAGKKRVITGDCYYSEGEETPVSCYGYDDLTFIGYLGVALGWSL